MSIHLPGGEGKLAECRRRWGVTSHHCRPADWRALWLRAETPSDSRAPPDDIFSWPKPPITDVTVEMYSVKSFVILKSYLLCRYVNE